MRDQLLQDKPAAAWEALLAAEVDRLGLPPAEGRAAVAPRHAGPSALDDAYDAYLRALSAGEDPDPGAYAARCPGEEEAFYTLLDVEDYLSDNGHLLSP